MSKMEEKLENHIEQRNQARKTRKDIMLIGIAIVSTSAAVYGLLV